MICMSGNETSITILKIEPMCKPEVVTVENTLRAFQQMVGGFIELLDVSDTVCILVNEEGKLNGLTPNRRFAGDILVGTILVVGRDGENLSSLQADELETYEALFHEPESIDLSELALRNPFGYSLF